MKYLGKIKVLNTFYKIYTHDEYKEINDLSLEWDKAYDRTFDESKFTGLSGYCLVTLKEIHIYTGFCAEYTNNTLRHELLHALLYELGCSNWDEEDFIDKISTWFPFMEDVNNQGRMLMKNARVKEEPRCEEDCKACLPNCE